MLTVAEQAAVNIAVDGILPGARFAVNMLEMPRNGVVLADRSGRRYAAPYSDGHVRPFPVEFRMIDEVMADAVVAAEELRDLFEKNDGPA